MTADRLARHAAARDALLDRIVPALGADERAAAEVAYLASLARVELAAR